MMRWLIFCAIFGAALPVLADTRALFTVESVSVEVTDTQALRARDNAIATARVIAYQRLLRRFIPEPEVQRAPSLSPGDLDRLVAAIEVLDEKAAGARHVARISVVFRPDEVRKRLKASGLPYSLTQARPALAILGAEGGDVAALRRGFEAAPKDGWLQNAVLPVGESDADIAQALNGDAGVLAALAQRAGVTTVAVVKAASAEAPAIQLSVQVWANAPRGPAQMIRMAPEPGENPDLFWTRVAGAALDRINEYWKRDSAQDYAVQINVRANARFANLAEWVAIREALALSPAVVKAEVEDLSIAQAHLALTVAGTPDRLAIALAQRDIRLEVEGETWRLSRMGAK